MILNGIAANKSCLLSYLQHIFSYNNLFHWPFNIIKFLTGHTVQLPLKCYQQSQSYSNLSIYQSSSHTKGFKAQHFYYERLLYENDKEQGDFFL